ncbi:hypothetical protein AB0J14_38310 [Micromonospora arborensis]|uniref:hypothetical protein n=1 Tax=Micromonospora arborensis TaxID=2116518 RepID=UPI0033E01AF9
MYGSTYDEPTTTRVPAGETDYLAKAAELLGRVSANNERDNSYPVSQAQTRLDLANRYAQLGAIQRGQMPVELARVMFEQLSGTRKEN